MAKEEKKDNTVKYIAGAAILLAGGYLLMGAKSAPAPPGGTHPYTNAGSGGAGSAGQIVGGLTSLAQQALKMITGGGGKPGQGGSSPSGQGGGGSNSGGAGSSSSQSQQSSTGKQANIPLAWTEDNSGTIRDANGTVVGERNSEGGINYTDGSVSYSDGVVWDNNTGYFYNDQGEVYLDDGTVIGQFDSGGNVIATEGALFDGSGAFLGWDNGNGTYTEDGTNDVYSNDGTYLGVYQGDGSYMADDGNLYNVYTSEPIDGGTAEGGTEEPGNDGGNNTAYDSQDPCDPTSAWYNEDICYGAPDLGSIRCLG